MAWIKARERKHVGRVLIDMVRVYVDGKQVTGVDGSSNPMVVILGTYDTPAIANTVKDDIEAWLKDGGNGVFQMPSEAELCGEKSQDDSVLCFFVGGQLDGLWVDIPNNVKEYVVGGGAGCTEIYKRNGKGSWFYLTIRCPGCGREGMNVSGLCPKCMAERICATCQHKRNSEACMCCIHPEHSKWEPKAVQDVKVLASHDASKPIYGMFNTQPGDMIEVVVRDETLTCKVIKTIRKLSSGDTVTAELKG